MAPKRNSKATSGAPTKKAKAGGILSGISRSAPGVVSIGSMVPSMNQFRATSFMQEDPIEDAESTFPPPPVLSRDFSTAGPAPAAITTAALVPLTGPIHVGSFCHFCCDGCSPPRQHECVECGAIICEQFLARSSGCIFLNSVDASRKTFLCPVCSRTAQEWRDKPLPYAFIGFGRRKKVKMTWPMAIINLSLESMKDDYLASAITLEAQNHYRSNPANVSTAVVYLLCITDMSDGVSFMCPPCACVALLTSSSQGNLRQD
ncbi:hypothetical protein P692DRAFT_20748184 [Suillus brevipes Sb2]|nr:hypothetical protein P692DRAFT_20748184 [Suillus brevipes Sb2]